MGQASAVMRRGATTFFHWCPACEQMHPLPDTWTFDGNLEQPTFSPSFRQLRVRDGKDCHYNIEAGEIVWHADSWHSRTGREPMVPLASVGMQDYPGGDGA